MKSLIEINEKQTYLDLPILQEKVADYAKNAFAKNTILNYESDWKHFAAWCKSLNIDPLNSTHNTLIAYITLLAEQKYKASTIQRKISGIIKYFEAQNLHINVQHKDFKIVWQGIRRKLGIAKFGKDPILLENLEAILKHIPNSPNSPMGIRDRALLSLGWFSAMRRSEIVNLNWQDLSFIEEGVLINIRQSKTDRYSQGQKIAVLKREYTCAIKYLEVWRKINPHESHEPVFCSITKSGKITGTRLSNIDVARIIKKWSSLIGLDTRKIAGHSLRRGFVTSAVNHGIRNHIIMKTTRHKSSKMIDDYTSDKSLVKNNASNMMSTQKPVTIINPLRGLMSYITGRVFKK